MTSKLGMSLDDIIKDSGNKGSGGKARGKQQKSGGRDGGRDGGRQKARSAPYSRPDTSDKDKKGRGNFQYGKDSTWGGGGGGGGMRGGRDGARGGGGGGGGDANTVFVGGLSEDVDWKALKAHMAQAGEVARADVVEGRGYGLVKFASAKGAKAAISQLHESELEGKTIVVRADKGGGGKGGGGKEGGGREGGGKGRGGGRWGGGGGGGEESEDDGYTYSGRQSAWVKPTGADFDDAPPPDPKGADALAR